MQAKLGIPRGWKGDLWVRMPLPEGELQGIPGEVLLEWAQAGLIHAIMIRRHPREVRLIYAPSLYGYLQSIPAERSLQEAAS